MGEVDQGLIDVIVEKDGHEQDSTTNQEGGGGSGVTSYVPIVVLQGQTLYSIAQNYAEECKPENMTAAEFKQEIADFNGISDPNQIQVGQELKIPKHF
ncbi:MAG: LysM domain-containing protein [Verrucomicrobiales bacterium]